jgi:enolase
MTHIANVHAREVLDSRGNPTVEVELRCDDGSLGRAIVPSGASTGRAEACELRDGDPDRYDGRGVRKAVATVNDELASVVIGLDPAEQAKIDQRLIEVDGSPQKSRLGANAVLGVSLAAAHAAAAAQRIPLFAHLHRLAKVSRADGPGAPRLPTLMVNMISGGLHAGGNLEFQDFLLVPHGTTDYPTALEWTVRVYRRLGELLSQAGYEGRLVGDEGGYGPRLQSNTQAADFVVRAIEAARLRPGLDASLAIDVASTHFFDGTHYRLRCGPLAPREDGGSNRDDTQDGGSGAATSTASVISRSEMTTSVQRLTSSAMIDQLEQLVDRFPIVSIEDGLAEEDWAGWQELTRRLGSRVRLIGDDLLVTNAARVHKALDLQAANAVLIKVNQVGTLSETLKTMSLAREHQWLCVVSARSGETEDTTMADLAVGTAAEQIKIGSVVRSERLAKYNRLLRIAEELDS